MAVASEKQPFPAAAEPVVRSPEPEEAAPTAVQQEEQGSQLVLFRPKLGLSYLRCAPIAAVPLVRPQQQPCFGRPSEPSAGAWAHEVGAPLHPDVKMKQQQECHGEHGQLPGSPQLRQFQRRKHPLPTWKRPASSSFVR